ncbi:archaeosortase/exosortase family protein [Kaarinaea lacus]
MKERLSIAEYRLILFVSFIALWPVWRWYGLRVYSSSEEIWGVVAVITAIVFLYMTRPLEKKLVSISWSIPIALIVFYIVALWFLPPLIRAVVAMGLITNLISQYWYQKQFHMGLGTLLMLALPVVASLQFYLGYPMRVAVGSMTEILLQFNGLSVVREGTVLNWGAQLISIDAPCSGVKLLWVSLYVSSALACFVRLSNVQTAALFSVLPLIVLCANVFRATALFYLESGILPMQSWMHSGVGLIATFFAVGIIVWCGLFFRGKQLWFREFLSYSV